MIHSIRWSGLLIWCFLELGNLRTRASVTFDFTQPEACQQWQALHDIAALRSTVEGMSIEISGNDPYLASPARDYPAGQPLWLRLRLKSESGGAGQVFYFDRQPDEAHSVRFAVRKGVWENLDVPLPSLGSGYRLRFDPPGNSGRCLLASLTCEPRVFLPEPQWPRPLPPDLSNVIDLKSGDVQLVHARHQWDGFMLKAAGQNLACGFTQPIIGYLLGTNLYWVTVADRAQVTVKRQTGALVSTAVFQDPHGATWRMKRRFLARPTGVIDCETELEVSENRTVLYLPMLLLLPGAGSFGEAKQQALFPGLEYLENEPSSSEADLIGPAAKRQVPDSLKITFPLMAILASNHYAGLIWNPQPYFSAVFDSPDRLFHSGGHVFGIIFPGSDGRNREEGRLLPYAGKLLSAKRPLRLQAVLLGGAGSSLVPAVRKYVDLRGLPPLPRIGSSLTDNRRDSASSRGETTRRSGPKLSCDERSSRMAQPNAAAQDYLQLAAAGWLNSDIRQDDLYRHAIAPGSFAAHPAADAAWMMDWLAAKTTNSTLAVRLREAAQAALAKVAPANYNQANIGHERYPVASLLYGHVAKNARQAGIIARQLLRRFEPDGSILYRPAKDQPDYGKTHFAREANGFTAPLVAQLLECATLCGDPDLIAEGLRCLQALDKFTHSVPRGAQTWEIPLHTPDILASAYLVRAYTLGYEITGNSHYLDQARYWAWTGVPFVYLLNPIDQPVGPYATIAVLGATQWKEPVWMGLPVQWCGLVYADALYRLRKHDPAAPWKRLADGITASGIQQTYPATEKKTGGLLPDSFNLRAQSRNPADINPGTVQANAIRLFGFEDPYTFQAGRQNAVFVHLPGTLAKLRERPGHLSFQALGWPTQPYFILVSGLRKTPQVKINGQRVTLEGRHQFHPAEGWLILQVNGQPRIEINLSRDGTIAQPK